ncbi:MAG: hypothetical protein QNJ73_14780 [Gammaproteobacteria bacterium]|nr:hypothetical protein [Gammaproteobacteria bacterium]
MTVLRSLTGLAAVLLLNSVAWSQSELMIYPNDGQDQEQQDKDNFECYSWAKGQSGFDPMSPPMATEQPPQQEFRQDGVARGALRGAAIGGIIDGSDGAKTGAAAGGALGGMRRADQHHREALQQQQWEQQQAQQYQQNRNNYNRAYAACMEGRDYTVR